MASLPNNPKPRRPRKLERDKSKHRSLAYDQMDIGEEDGEPTAEWYCTFAPLF